nr:H98 [uncultured bacterium]
MRIVIDMQGAQAASGCCGIGSHTLSFALAIARNRGAHEVILALNGLFPDTIEPIRAAFSGLLRQDNIRVWHASGPISEGHPGNEARRAVAELVREAFLASLLPDVLHIGSPFGGCGDDVVTSIGRVDHRAQVSATLFDPISVVNSAHHITPDSRCADYDQRVLAYLKKAAIYLVLSEFSKCQWVEHMGAPKNRFINISAAIEPRFRPLGITDAAAALEREKLGLVRPFVLCVSSADEDNNLPRLIQAFAQLPAQLRGDYQLVLAGRMGRNKITDFNRAATVAGLSGDEFCFTGYVTDEELVQLYNLCHLFVFPSRHEGFGLPALEAMACGAPVIGANIARLSEVIGLRAALFDPLDITAITKKMAQALTDNVFRASLRAHGLRQAKRFSWDESAQRALAAWQALLNTPACAAAAALPESHSLVSGRKPRLAFVSPLPPERTGIADYSAELLSALATHYDIDVVVAQNRVEDAWVNTRCTVRDAAWLRGHASEVDRVVYQLGNSPFHAHILPLLQEIPGTVVLHDFYLGGLMAWLELVAAVPHAWTQALYLAHGYDAVRERYREIESTKHKYPVNFGVLQHAQGLIIHSSHSQRLIQHWYVEGGSRAMEVIPHLRSPVESLDKNAARRRLGLAADDFVICSFGFLGPTKLNHRLLAAWLDSALAYDARCHLVFVGENHGDDYGASLLRTLRASSLGKRIRITGFATPELFRQYLMAADMAVQLRTLSRGETSGTVLDCMNYGLPLIVNANGSMAELDTEAVWLLPDEFDDAALTTAIETLRQSSARRQRMGARGREVILHKHSPAECARRYTHAIERFHQLAETSQAALVRAIAAQQVRSVSGSMSDAELMTLAAKMSATLPLPRPAKRLFLDISATCRNDLKTGIERVARALLLALLDVPPAGFRIEPVYLSAMGDTWHYRYAHRYTLGLLGCPAQVLGDDERVEPECGDMLLGLDLSGDILVQAAQTGLFADWRNRGVAVYSVVFDLLPVRMPEMFPPGADQVHSRWLRAVSTFDGAIGISRAVADDLAAWRSETGFDRQDRRPFRIGAFHLGADVANSAPSLGLRPNAERTLRQLRARPTFLLVGTIEPRKGYLQIIGAFSRLWSEGVDVNLVIVGKEGWKGLPKDLRRDIPETLNRLRTHPERKKRLFWLDGISDEYLEKVYAASTCLIAASYGEGFGLPLIEAAQHKLPIIARDIPVFREVVGEHAYYFEAESPDSLARQIGAWLTLYAADQHPKSSNSPSLTWRESALQLIDVILSRCPDQP